MSAIEMEKTTVQFYILLSTILHPKGQPSHPHFLLRWQIHFVSFNPVTIQTQQKRIITCDKEIQTSKAGTNSSWGMIKLMVSADTYYGQMDSLAW